MSEEITLEQAHRLIGQACRLLVEGHLAEVDTFRLTGNPGARWLHVSWTELLGDDVNDMDTRFLEGNNQLIPCDSGTIRPMNENGVRLRLTLLCAMDIEKELNHGE